MRMCACRRPTASPTLTPQVDYAAAKDHVAGRHRRTIAPVDSQERFEGLGVRVIRDIGPLRLGRPRCEAGEHRHHRPPHRDRHRLRRPSCRRSRGSTTVPYLTNETLWDLREKPGHLLIIGGGPIGMEMAQAHRRLGCEVTVIEGAKALGKDDPETGGIVLERLREEGVEIAEDAQGQRRCAATAGSDRGRGRGWHDLPRLASAGRGGAQGQHRRARPRQGRDQDDADRHRGGRRRCGRTNKAVYAIGDAAGGLQFTHVAGYHAGIVIRSALFGLPAKAQHRAPYPLGHLHRPGTGAGRPDRGAGRRRSTAPRSRSSASSTTTTTAPSRSARPPA